MFFETHHEANLIYHKEVYSILHVQTILWIIQNRQEIRISFGPYFPIPNPSLSKLSV